MSGQVVQLWMYDLSKGMAKKITNLFSRREIDGIWHSSIVVFDREIWFGDGITTCVPGTCHLGMPHQVMTLGVTQVDERTFNDFLDQTRQLFSEERYHLLDLPIDFLSTTIGWVLNPAIQRAYRAATAGSENATPAETAPGYVDMVWSTGAWALGAVVSTSTSLVGSSLGRPP
ncbi:hypothetical protein M408DRAFT_331638 [Serendipita vermifera MAFF 305830]|uniref:PPPDE domain-containing protein n=1 Tax=Serendipita vermifera MAFF 305830 TaxID=933852 RepID=A0A0C3AJ78_SERVB|nr:hypothetical protein M408DRAFT_331638 [Serendipita vermifera MAFF 305830]